MRRSALLALVAVSACSSAVPRGAAPPGAMGPAGGPDRIGAGVVIAGDRADVVGIATGAGMIGPRRTDVPASKEEVYDHIVRAFGSRYLVTSGEAPKRVQAERKLGSNLINVLVVELFDGKNENTTIAVRGWTDDVSGVRTAATRYDYSLRNDFEDVFRTVSCDIAKWQRCSSTR